MNNTYLILPLGWIIKPTKSIFSVFNGSTPSSSEPSYWNGNIYWVTPEDIGSLKSKLLQDTKRKITQEGYKSCGTQLVPINSIILTTRAPVGNIALADVPLCTNQGCKTLVPKLSHTYSDYFYYQLIARKEELASLAKGTTFQELGTTELLSFNLLYPSHSEQKAIANYLDKETAKIDQLIKTKKRLLELLDEKRRALITHAVTRGLNPDVTLQKVNIPWLDVIPRHWHIERAKYLFTQSSLSVRDEDEIVTCFRDGQVTLRRNRREEGFTNAILELGYQGIRSGQLVLHSMDAFAGAIGISDSDGKCSPEYIICDPINKNLVFNPYYGYLLQEMALRGFIQASCPAVRERAPRIRFSSFSEMLLPIPPLIEQELIVNHIKDKARIINTLMQTTKKTIHLLQERRTSLITAAVTGEIKIT
ncbi:restriction endonuclease subunit S [Limnospira platensis]|uniref:restriction endonuclease subunit S n=1 Tax=Limnospira platensis TaxID=118562 RepID=UPI0002803D24|nr:restriction modification system DNA specificity domain protein [Arthrospira platensis C1]UWU45973.1 type I restriction enzyme, S subunit [Arthrospira platensis C1]